MKKNILIVDDEQFLINSMQRDLRQYNDKYEVYVTTKSRDTLKLIKQLKIDLLIIDIIMPEKEGLEIIREVKSEFPSVKLIAMTGGPVSNLEFAKLLGADYSLNKPFSHDELVLATNSALQ
ncbi:MAG: response regulator [Gammaproteobacteria bacterium]|nr:response regulator [Gammaproteobacteria bacterium]